MKMTTGAAMALALLPLSHAAAATDLDAIVKAVMEDQYGKHYDAGHACWVFAYTTEQGNDLTYCMRPGKAERVDTPKGAQLFVRAANVFDMSGAGYDYGQVDPGLMGAFQLSLDANGGWTYLALDNALEFGSAGQCGCADARFVKLSDHGDYGWLFVSGGVWQGIVVADYAIVTPHKGGFVDVSRVPQSRENAQDVRYELKIVDDAAAGGGLFPLVVSKTRDGAAPEDIPVRFDAKTYEYRLPKGK